MMQIEEETTGKAPPPPGPEIEEWERDPGGGSMLLRLLWPVLLAGTIVTASGGQIAHGPNLFDADKVAHILFFGLLATHLCRYPSRREARLSWGQALFAVLITTLFGFSDEPHQSLNPYRTYDLWDLCADFTGSVIATAAYQHWPWYRHLLERRLFAGRGKLEDSAKQ